MPAITSRRGPGASGSWSETAQAWRENARTLLIVDDEEGPRQSLRLIFEDLYNVLLAKTGYEALELARHRPVDAAVVDIRMAGMSGIELLRHLKAIDAGVEVTILTAYAALETARQALRLGASDYLTKPFDLETIRSAVARMMERRALNQRTEANLKRLQQLESEVQNLREPGESSPDHGGVYGHVLHDINKPLTVIVGMLSVLNRRLGDVERVEGEEMAELRQRLKSLNRQADNVIDVIQRYLGFLRHERRGAAVVSVNQVLLDLRELLRVYPGAQDRELSLELPPADLVAGVNSTDLLQILLNLAVNALEATPAGGRIGIAAGLSSGPPDASLDGDVPGQRVVQSPDFDRQGPRVRVTIRNDGPGIAPELFDRILDAPVTSKPRGHGTGLGLTIVKKLVLLNRGALILETARGLGTTATVLLPATTPAAPTSPTL